jgi:biopolymer transport protein ExbB/TolQ
MNVVMQSKQLMLTLGAAPVMWLMLALSLVSVAIIVERALYYRRVSADFPRLMSALSTHLCEGDLRAAHAVVADSASAEAHVVRAGFNVWQRGPRAVREALSSAMAVQKNVLERRLGVLGTLGNNAPFVGLLGTVIGIMLAFEELANAGQGAAATAGVMSSIAEALVATAIGLLVAIPAVAAFNWFQRRIRTITSNSEALAHLLLIHLEPAEPQRTSRSPGLAGHHSATRDGSLSLCVGE